MKWRIKIQYSHTNIYIYNIYTSIRKRVSKLAALFVTGFSSHHSISTLSPRQNKAGIGHVITQVDMCPPAQYPSPFLQGYVCFYGNSVGADYWAVGSSLTLDFATFSISVYTANKKRKNISITGLHINVFPDISSLCYDFSSHPCCPIK